MSTTKLFTVAGITTHTGVGVTLDKVRFGTDFIRVIKMLNNHKKIWHTETKQCLIPKRVDIVELPHEMSKQDAIQFLISHADFQSPEDQALLQEALRSRSPKSPRKTRAVKVKADPQTLSIDSIRSRERLQPTVEQVLAAVTES